MDMRTFGKDYERYYERAKNDYGVRFVRSRPHTVIRITRRGRLTVRLCILKKERSPERRAVSTWWCFPPVSGSPKTSGSWPIVWASS